MTKPPKTQPWLHDLEIAVGGNSCVLGGRDGDIAPAGAQGWLVDDERLLDRLTLQVGGCAVTGIGASSRGGRSEFFGAVRGIGDPGPDPTVEVRRARRVSGLSLVETIEITSRASSPVRTEAIIVLSGDGAQVARIKNGGAEATMNTTRTGETVTWTTSRHLVNAAVEEAGLPLGASIERSVTPEGGVRFAAPLELVTGSSARLTVTVSARRLAPSNFDADVGAGLVTWSPPQPADPRLAALMTASLEDLRSLLLTDPMAPADVFAAAGAPWYLTLFGRDSLWTARLALPLGTDLAAGTLRALARRQGVGHDSATAEAPGKIPHEVRRVAYVDTEHGFTLPPVYWGTVDATALWVCLLHDAWLAGLAEATVRELLPNLRAAMRWLLAVSEHGTQPVRYIDGSGSGLANQGWKDSGDSIRWADGRIAHSPIALVEAQAYAVEAAAGARRLLAEFGDPQGGDADLVLMCATLIEGLSRLVRERFWVERDGWRHLALALDGHGEAVDGIGSNMGHCLGTGLLTPEEVALVVQTLLDPILLGRHGIRTLSTDNEGFNPMGYHTGSVWAHDTAIIIRGLLREGWADEARDLAERLLDAGAAFGYRMPELFGDEGPLGRPVPYPASCRPQAWSPAAALVIAEALP